MKPGLVSITFRKLNVTQIIALCEQAELAGIEWGGDVHVPAGQAAIARDVGRATRQAGLAVAAYGSYYRVGVPEAPFSQVLESARELGAPMIRVWAGRQGSVTADDGYRRLVIDDARRIADAAAAHGIGIVLEYHANTLTDTSASAVALLEAIDHANVKSYWQPPKQTDKSACLSGLRAIRPWLAGLHVFQWHLQTVERQPLAVGRDAWRDYLRIATEACPDGYALLEFVENDDPAALLRDAATLRDWLADGPA